MTDITFRSDLPVREIAHMGDDLMIARAAWEDWDREPKGEGHLSGMLGGMTGDLHGSPFEFGALVVHIEAPLFVAAQAVRHRIGVSPAHRSARYRRMLPHFYVPDEGRPLTNTGSKMRPEFAAPDWQQWDIAQRTMEVAYRHAWDAYQWLLAEQVAEEIARAVLPQATYTGWSTQFNPRSLMKFLQLRVQDERNRYDTRPQWEIEQVARQIEAIFAQHWPVTHAAFCEHGRVAP